MGSRTLTALPRAAPAAVIVALGLALAVALPARAAPPAATPAAAGDEVPSDERRAGEHYRRAQELYDQGDYEAAIPEFEAAFRLMPHPIDLYNIAQAHERLLEYGESVRWFERYLKEAPADADRRPVVENRLRILRNLPARISVTTIPEHVHVRVRDDAGHAYQGDTPALFKVPAGRYTVALEQNGWDSESHTVTAEIGQPYFYQYRLRHATAQVTIFTRPSGARVFIDDRLVGETPFAEAIEVGKHKLLLEHRDYPWHREELEVRPNQPVKLDVKLTRPSRSGRTELVLASMVYGGAIGPLFVSALSTDPKFGTSGYGLLTYMLSSAAGIGAGFVGSFLATRDGIKVGHSSLIIGGGAWGTTLAAALGFGLGIPRPYEYALSLGGGAIGLTAAALVARWHDISAGDAALVNSGGIWGTAAGALMAQAVLRSPGGREFGWFILGGTSLGLVTNSLLAWKLELPRGRVALIDLSGLCGTGLGFVLGYVIGLNSDDSVQSGARYALGGMAVSLLAGAVFSRKFQGDLPPVRALLQHESEPGKPARWALGLPAMNIEPALTPEGRGTRFVFTLARGTW